MAVEPHPASLTEHAPAKINLSLHVHGRREDGYHDLESLVAFADVADTLTLTPGEAFSLAVDGPTAGASGPVENNLVTRAVRLLSEQVPGLRSGAFTLTKILPAAGGVGGGSTDAAAALRLLARVNGLAPDDARLWETARTLGADVPVCLERQARMMRGAGEQLARPIQLPSLYGVLVNPGLPVETGPVFAALGLARGERRQSAPHPEVTGEISARDLLKLLASARNDLEAPAMQVRPEIADILDLLGRQTGLRLARMSGSGGTCFGIFETLNDVFEAVRNLRRQRGQSWVQPARIG